MKSRSKGSRGAADGPVDEALSQSREEGLARAKRPERPTLGQYSPRIELRAIAARGGTESWCPWPMLAIKTGELA